VPEALLTHILPTSAEAKQAEETSRLLSPRLRSKTPLRLRVIGAPDDETVVIPASAAKMLVGILNEMGRGNTVTVIPVHAELTTQEAAEMLSISRPSLIQLLDEGKIEYRKVGTHRRVRFESLLGYKKRVHAERLATLSELAAYDQEIGIWFVATLGAFFDANVLYSSGLRNFLMHLALTGLFRAHWSAEVHDEWIRNLLKNRPDLTREKLDRTRHLMDKALPDALVAGYEHLIDTIDLPDRDDRHVLAAAVYCRATIIVTHNLADFPSGALAQFKVDAQSPDDFVLALMDVSADLVLEAARSHRASLRNPTKTTEEYLAGLETQGLTRTVVTLRELIGDEPTAII
jgi:excisionase family DNA binding protein